MYIALVFLAQLLTIFISHLKTNKTKATMGRRTSNFVTMSRNHLHLLEADDCSNSFSSTEPTTTEQHHKKQHLPQTPPSPKSVADQQQHLPFAPSIRKITQCLREFQYSDASVVETAMDQIYVTISEEDSKMTSEGRRAFQHAIFELDACRCILGGIFKYTSTSFRRRAVSTLAFLVKDSREQALHLVHLGGLKCLFQCILQDASCSAVSLQRLSLQLFGTMLSVAPVAVMEQYLPQLIDWLVELEQQQGALPYDRACQSLCVGTSCEVLCRQLSQLSRSYQLYDGTGQRRKAVLEWNVRRVQVCHDLLPLLR